MIISGHKVTIKYVPLKVFQSAFLGFMAMHDDRISISDDPRRSLNQSTAQFHFHLINLVISVLLWPVAAAYGYKPGKETAKVVAT
jgi:hypothetical protein